VDDELAIVDELRAAAASATPAGRTLGALVDLRNQAEEGQAELALHVVGRLQRAVEEGAERSGPHAGDDAEEGAEQHIEENPRADGSAREEGPVEDADVVHPHHLGEVALLRALEDD